MPLRRASARYSAYPIPRVPRAGDTANGVRVARRSHARACGMTFVTAATDASLLQLAATSAFAGRLRPYMYRTTVQYGSTVHVRALALTHKRSLRCVHHHSNHPWNHRGSHSTTHGGAYSRNSSQRSETGKILDGPAFDRNPRLSAQCAAYPRVGVPSTQYGSKVQFEFSVIGL